MRRQALIGLLLLPALTLAGCGGGKGTGTAKEADAEDKMLKYAQCMRDNGLQVSDPQDGNFKIEVDSSGEPSKAEAEKLKAAEKKCRHLMPNGGKPPRKPGPEEMDRLRAMAACMRQNGVPEFPDPDPDTGAIQVKGGKGTNLDPDSPTFKRAHKICDKSGGKGGRHKSENDDGGPGLSGGGDG